MRAATQACYYTAESPAVCDSLPSTCTYPAYSEGGFSGDNAQCEGGCKREYDTPSSGHSQQRFAKCGSSCCRAKSGSSTCYYTAEDATQCDALPSNCTFASYFEGGNSAGDDTAHCTTAA